MSDAYYCPQNFKWRFKNESSLQWHLAKWLSDEGWQVQREVSVAARDRRWGIIDLLAKKSGKTRVIECKQVLSWVNISQATRQLCRYSDNRIPSNATLEVIGVSPGQYGMSRASDRSARYQIKTRTDEIKIHFVDEMEIFEAWLAHRYFLQGHDIEGTWHKKTRYGEFNSLII